MRWFVERHLPILLNFDSEDIMQGAIWEGNMNPLKESQGPKRQPPTDAQIQQLLQLVSLHFCSITSARSHVFVRGFSLINLNVDPQESPKTMPFRSTFATKSFEIFLSCNTSVGQIVLLKSNRSTEQYQIIISNQGAMSDNQISLNLSENCGLFMTNIFVHLSMPVTYTDC